MPSAMPSQVMLELPPGRHFLSEAAQAVWTHLAGYDAPTAHIVVPTAAQIPALRQALQNAAGGVGVPVLLPRIVTLGHWLLDLPPSPDEPPPRTYVTRLLTIQQAIRAQPWLQQRFGLHGDGAAWGLAQTLLTVSDALSERWLTLDAICADFAEHPTRYDAMLQAALEKGYASLAERFLGDESRIVTAFWRMLAEPTDPVPLRLQAMCRLAEHVSGPVVWLAPTPAEPVEAAWLTRIAERVPVLQIGYAWTAHTAKRQLAEDSQGLTLPILGSVWPECVQDGSSATAPTVVTSPAVRLCSAARFEDEAAIAAQTLVQWLNEGRKQLALVAHDRVVARRVRALLARAGAPVSDETGWKLSTTRAAAALMRWFDVVVTGGEHLALLDFLKSPYCLPSLPDRGHVISTLEQLIRRYGVTGGWSRLKQVATRAVTSDGDGLAAADATVLSFVATLAEEAARWTAPAKRSLGAWLTLADETLDRFDMRTALTADEAGRQLLDCLRRLGLRGDAGQMDGVVLSLAEWRALIGVILESEVFKEPAPTGDCRIVVLPLNGARMRRFEGVVVVGCDDGQLPSAAPELMFLSNAVRRELGLADREARFIQQARDLAEVLLNNDEVVLTWQRTGSQGEPRALSGWLQRLAQWYAAHDIALVEKVSLPVLKTHSAPQQMPRPTAPMLVPTRLSAAAYQALRRCPYQFFADRMLRLAELEEPSEQLEKRAIGELLHTILLRYHSTLDEAPTQHTTDAHRLTVLAAISAEVFDALLTFDGNALPFYHRWTQVMPAYVEWQRAREAEGWTWVAGEVARTQVLSLADGGELTLHGRLDRVDRHTDGTVAVLDYKTQSMKILREKASNIYEDCQLAFYGLLAPEVEQGAWVALEDSEGMKADRAVALPDYPEAVEWLARQIGEDIMRLRAGAALPAFGDESACRYCDARGLCRKGYWGAVA